MDTIKIKKQNTKIIAHRGLSGLERENTYPAFIAAGNRSYYGVETDVHVTKDGKFVIIHDESTKKVSLGAYDVDVEKSNFDDLKDLVFPDLDGSSSRRDIKIPLLQDYINICKKYDKICVLELKNRFNKSDIVKMIDIIKELNYLEKVIFISFSYDNCVDLRSLLPNAQIQFLMYKELNDSLIEELLKYKFDLDIHFSLMNKEWVEKLHSLNVLVNVWTCDDKNRAEELAIMGVDFITTNILE